MKQMTLRPQDLLVLLKMACNASHAYTYPELSLQLGISVSEAHGSKKRLTAAQLLVPNEESGSVVNRKAARDFVITGARYAFPGSLGTLARGMPTAHSAPPLVEMLAAHEEDAIVWPTPDGKTRGLCLTPLYPSVPDAAARDSELYECLALFDALRAGTTRERELATTLLERKL